MIFSQSFVITVKIFLVSLLLTFHVSSAATINEKQEVSLYVYDNLVSANMSNLTLDIIVKEFTRQASIKFFIPEAMLRIRISTRFQGLSIIEAIRKILRNENYVMYIPQQLESGNKGGSNSRIQVYMLSSNNKAYKIEETKKIDILKDNSKLSDIVISKRGSNPLIENIDYSVVMDISQDTRIEGLNTLVEEHASNALPIVIGSLMDESPNVRMTALQLVLDNSIGEIPIDTLSRLSLSDENQDVRILAKKILAEHYEIDEPSAGRPPE